jgi:uncharacterized protein YbaP (TraB family)
MKKQPQIWLFSTLLVLTASFSTLYSQALDNSLLWEITGPGLKKPSYLFGTFHLMCSEQIQPTDALKEKLGKADQLCLELDMDDPATRKQMETSILLPPGKKLTQFCSPSDSAIINAFLKSTVGATLDQMAVMKPLVLMQLVYLPLLGCQPDSWEMRLTQMAIDQKKEVKGLETVAFQMGIFDNIPYATQVDWVVEYLSKNDQTVAEFKSLVKSYQEQNLNAMVELVNASPQFRDHAEVLLDQRNRNWAEQIPAMAKQKSTFFAVGAGHLGGENGIITLLKQKGYTLRPVKNS